MQATAWQDAMESTSAVRPAVSYGRYRRQSELLLQVAMIGRIGSMPILREHGYKGDVEEDQRHGQGVTVDAHRDSLPPPPVPPPVGAVVALPTAAGAGETGSGLAGRGIFFGFAGTVASGATVGEQVVLHYHPPLADQG